MSSIDRKYIHDLNNSLAIALGNARRITRKITKTPDDISMEMVLQISEIIISELERMNTLIQNHRQVILEREDSPSAKE